MTYARSLYIVAYALYIQHINTYSLASARATGIHCDIHTNNVEICAVEKNKWTKIQHVIHDLYAPLNPVQYIQVFSKAMRIRMCSAHNTFWYTVRRTYTTHHIPIRFKILVFILLLLLLFLLQYYKLWGVAYLLLLDPNQKKKKNNGTNLSPKNRNY